MGEGENSRKENARRKFAAQKGTKMQGWEAI